jgi:hypothetical protein
VYAKSPFAGPKQVLRYLSRYTHRVAISNSRLRSMDEHGVTFDYKDYRADGQSRYKKMTLSTDEFMRRFLLHVLPTGFHRIRHYGILANTNHKETLTRVRELLHVAPVETAEPEPVAESTIPAQPTFTCRCCGAAMIVVGILERQYVIRAPPRWRGQP